MYDNIFDIMTLFHTDSFYIKIGSTCTQQPTWYKNCKKLLYIIK